MRSKNVYLCVYLALTCFMTTAVSAQAPSLKKEWSDAFVNYHHTSDYATLAEPMNEARAANYFKDKFKRAFFSGFFSEIFSEPSKNYEELFVTLLSNAQSEAEKLMLFNALKNTKREGVEAFFKAQLEKVKGVNMDTLRSLEPVDVLSAEPEDTRVYMQLMGAYGASGKAAYIARMLNIASRSVTAEPTREMRLVRTARSMLVRYCIRDVSIANHLADLADASSLGQSPRRWAKNIRNKCVADRERLASE